ncbi:MAG: hypothetical protein JF609_08400 [Verrucomicrobia bacterium]|nr:hypothetical protein [Verrucomicrobiota bacterium]
MVDAGIAQAVTKAFNGWCRRKAKPHGTVDHYYRGIRMTTTTSYRLAGYFISVLLLLLAGFILLYGDPFDRNTPLHDIVLLSSTLLMTILGVLAPMEAFRDFTVITEDGLLKSNLFGTKTSMNWSDIHSFQINPDGNTVTFFNEAKQKLKMSLCYDGWQDFLETASRKMNRALCLQFSYAFFSLNTPKASKLKTPRSSR